MTWKSHYFFDPFGYTERSTSPPGTLKKNEQCFIRKDHKCGKFFGASKSCFIACPTDDEIEPILELMSEKLAKIGIEPIIAVKERAYGQDIFCTKICGKIIESKFCIVILDDTIKDETNIPNPNVYYEYGLMTSLKKHIIPLQNDKLDLAFNIQSYDTIKYTSKNIGSELDRAIKDAVRLSEQQKKDTDKNVLSDKTILRRMEVAGFQLKEDDEWFLNDVIEDTNFKGFSHQDNGFYVFIGRVDSKEDLQPYLEDLDVVTYRIEKNLNKMQENFTKLSENNERLQKSIAVDSKEDSGLDERTIRSPKNFGYQHRKRSEELNNRISKLEKIYIGFIVGQNIDSIEFIKSAKATVQQYGRYKIVYSTSDKIKFDQIAVSLTPTTL